MCGPRPPPTPTPGPEPRSTPGVSETCCDLERRAGDRFPPVWRHSWNASSTFRAMNVPDDLRYTPDHEWARLEGDQIRIGITDYAQDALGDVVFVQLPEPGVDVQAGESFAEVESTKSVSDVYAPLNGTVVEINAELGDSPQKLNED